MDGKRLSTYTRKIIGVLHLKDIVSSCISFSLRCTVVSNFVSGLAPALQKAAEHLDYKNSQVKLLFASSKVWRRIDTYQLRQWPQGLCYHSSYS